MMANVGCDTAYSRDLTLTEAWRILKGECGPVSRKEAVEMIEGEISRLNGIINTQARVIADVRKALGVR